MSWWTKVGDALGMTNKFYRRVRGARDLLLPSMDDTIGVGLNYVIEAAGLDLPGNEKLKWVMHKLKKLLKETGDMTKERIEELLEMLAEAAYKRYKKL